VSEELIAKLASRHISSDLMQTSMNILAKIAAIQSVLIANELTTAKDLEKLEIKVGADLEQAVEKRTREQVAEQLAADPKSAAVLGTMLQLFGL